MNAATNFLKVTTLQDDELTRIVRLLLQDETVDPLNVFDDVKKVKNYIEVHSREVEYDYVGDSLLIRFRPKWTWSNEDDYRVEGEAIDQTVCRAAVLLHRVTVAHYQQLNEDKIRVGRAMRLDVFEDSAGRGVWLRGSEGVRLESQPAIYDPLLLKDQKADMFSFATYHLQGFTLSVTPVEGTNERACEVQFEGNEHYPHGVSLDTVGHQCVERAVMQAIILWHQLLRPYE